MERFPGLGTFASTPPPHQAGFSLLGGSLFPRASCSAVVLSCVYVGLGGGRVGGLSLLAGLRPADE